MCINYHESVFLIFICCTAFMMTQKSHTAGKLKQPLRLDLAGFYIFIFLAVFVSLTNVMNLYSKTTSGACDSHRVPCC